MWYQIFCTLSLKFLFALRRLNTMISVRVFRQFFYFKDTCSANFQGDKASAYFSPFILKHTHTHIYIIYINCRCSPQSRKLVSFPANGMTVKAIERPNWQRPTRPHRPHNKVRFKHSVSCCCFFLLVLYSSFSIKCATHPLLLDCLLAFFWWLAGILLLIFFKNSDKW